ncbi:C-factor-like [Crotalus adamanteus]|uniref:C-factor-like n=2 Tax=Crotalus adamanteus TaxID=8729 RepID=A0AAW1ASQ4_CROAD
MEQLNPRSVLVTGSNRGLGLELVRKLAKKSNPPKWIFATCRDPAGPRAQELKNLAAEHPQIVIMALDVDDPSSIKAAAAKVTECLKGAGLNLLINNAGIINITSLETETPESMANTYRINVIGPMIVVQGFIPLLRKAAQESPLKGMSCSKAAIVNISSEAGSITSVLEWQRGHVIAYRCSKCALNMLSKCQSLHLAKDEILCVALHPGWVQTDMGNLMGTPPLTMEQSLQAILNTLGRLSEKNTGTFVNWEGNLVPLQKKSILEGHSPEEGGQKKRPGDKPRLGDIFFNQERSKHLGFLDAASAGHVCRRRGHVTRHAPPPRARWEIT